jgi:hypothetical protein
LKEGEIASWPVRVMIGVDKVCWDFNVHVVFNVRGPNPKDLTRVLAVARFGYWETSFEPGVGQCRRSASSYKRSAVLDAQDDLGNHEA